MTDKFLTVNPFSRPGKIRPKTLALVIHWTANPGQDWNGVWQYFEDRKNGKLEYGSSQYVVGLKGEVVRIMPDNEVAYHCGSSKIDPESGKVYTDLARAKFGKYATDLTNLSPNMVTTGIECCVTGADGKMNYETIEATINLAVEICKKYELDPIEDILLHKSIVGWKDCHRWFVTYPEGWANFKADVKKRMKI
jgi:N-acetylmuramoyl-L-alanine amidase